MSDIEQIHAYANKLRTEATRYEWAALNDRRYRLLAEAAQCKLAGLVANEARILAAAKKCAAEIALLDLAAAPCSKRSANPQARRST